MGTVLDVRFPGKSSTLDRSAMRLSCGQRSKHRLTKALPGAGGADLQHTDNTGFLSDRLTDRIANLLKKRVFPKLAEKLMNIGRKSHSSVNAARKHAGNGRKNHLPSE